MIFHPAWARRGTHIHSLHGYEPLTNGGRAEKNLVPNTKTRYRRINKNHFAAIHKWRLTWGEGTAERESRRLRADFCLQLLYATTLGDRGFSYAVSGCGLCSLINCIRINKKTILSLAGTVFNSKGFRNTKG